MDSWIQKADGSIVQIQANYAEQAIRAFDQFDWDTERKQQKILGEENSVSPGFGFGAWGDDRFMHIVPYQPNDIEVLYAKTSRRKWLGFFPIMVDHVEQYVGEHLSHQQLSEIIHAYFSQDDKTILKFCKK